MACTEREGHRGRVEGNILTRKCGRSPFRQAQDAENRNSSDLEIPMSCLGRPKRIISHTNYYYLDLLMGDDSLCYSVLIM